MNLQDIARDLREQARRHRLAAADRKPGAVEKLVEAVLGDGEEED